MATMDYVEIPASATRLQSSDGLKPATKVTTPLPQPTRSPSSSSSFAAPPMLGTSAAFNVLPTMLLSSVPTPSQNPRGTPQLLSTRDPLSIPITTVNFKRFVAKSGPIFWLQDRIEEIVMWRRGWKSTAIWIAAYAFLCFFPRLVLLLPHVILLGIMMSTYSFPTTDKGPTSPTGEGSVDWQANLQAIQNLMGAVSDAYDTVIPFVPHLTHGSSYTPHILTFTVLSGLLLLPVLHILPLRPAFFFLGLAPFFLTHPRIRTITLRPALVPLRARVLHVIDNDRLPDPVWPCEMRTVELWENERGGPDSTWSKSTLKLTERAPWTRGRDGWSGVGADVSSNLTFSLGPGWRFVETESWRADVEATWSTSLGDQDGWVYTNDTWMDPHPIPREEWKGAVTRRRRWTRRIYFDVSVTTS